MPFRNLIYILQAEQYDVKRFIKWALWNIAAWITFRKIEVRQKIDWTLKAKILFTASWMIAACIIIMIFWLTQALLIVVAGALLIFIFSPLILLAALILIWPLDFLAKLWIVRKAKRRLKKFPDLKIIGITGSYGKTTMKEALSSLLSAKFKILRTPENINTAVGVAKIILKKLRPEHEIFIVEMGAFKKGDIKKLCRLAPPAISILTGINEAHLDRFGSLKNTIEAKFEIVKFMRKNGIAYLNSKNKLVLENFSRFCEGKNVKFYPSLDITLSGQTFPTYVEAKVGEHEILMNGEKDKYEIRNTQWLDETGGFSFEILKNTQKLLEAKTKILGSYILDTLLCAVMIAESLGVDPVLIAERIPQIKPIEHRLCPIQGANNVLVIDDAYNGNPDGAAEAMETLKRFKNRRRIYITPGLVELSGKSAEIHEKLGLHLAQCADIVIFIKNSATPFIEKGLLKGRFEKENIVWFKTAQAAHAELGSLLQPNDVVLFQNDWPDQYF